METPTGLELIRRGYADQFINNPGDSRAIWYDPVRDCVIREINSPIARHAISLLKDSFAVESIDDNIIVQRKLRFPNHIGVWSSVQIRYQASFILALFDLLSGLGIHLYDGHPWNIMFDGAELRWVDLGSLQDSEIPVGSCKTQIHQYVAFADLFRIGYCRKLRANPFWGSNVEKMLQTGFEGLAEIDPNLSYSEKFYRLRDNEARPREGTWVGYSKPLEILAGNETADEYDTTLGSVISEYNIKSMIDIGCNNGKFSAIAARRGVKVLALDVEDTLICELFDYALKEKLPITPVVADLTLYCRVCRFTHERFRPKVDLILAYAILHHMVHQAHPDGPGEYDFESFFEEIENFEPQTLILGFVGYDDIAFVDPEDRKPWYTLDKLLTTIDNVGYSTEITPTNNPARQILVCRRKG